MDCKSYIGNSNICADNFLGPASVVMFGIALVVLVISLVANWKLFVKAGQPGWASLVPLYNVYILLKICKKSGWLLLLFLIPYVGSFIFSIILGIEIAKAFGKGAVFAIFLLILLPIGYWIIGFDKSKYAYSTTTATPTPPKPQSPPQPTIPPQPTTT